MKFICPESQKRVFLKCGSIDSGSEVAAALAGSSAPAGGVALFGAGGGVAAVCCACARIVHVAITISDNTARSVLAVQRIDLRFRFAICPVVNLSACT